MEFTAKQIADYLGGEIEGDAGVLLHDFAKIEEGAPGCLTFLANEKYEHFIYNTPCSAALVNRTFRASRSLPAMLTLIRVDDAYASLAKLMQLAAAAETKPSGIDSLAFIHPTASIGEGCYIGAFAYVGEGAVLEDGVYVYPHVFIDKNVRVGRGTIFYPQVCVYHGCIVGKNCIVHAGAVIGADGFGFAPGSDGYTKIPQLGIVEVADSVEIGANTCVDRAAMGKTTIARGVKLDNLVQIAHNCSVGQHTVIAAQAGLAGSTHVGDFCRLGGQVGVAGHIRIGDRVELGGQAGILGDVAAGSAFLGTPAVPVRDFLRASALVRRLPQLLTRIEELEKQIKEINNDTQATHP